MAPGPCKPSASSSTFAAKAGNAEALRAIQGLLATERYERSLVRILDAALWLSRPAAGGPDAGRRFSVEMLPPPKAGAG